MNLGVVVDDDDDDDDLVVVDVDLVESDDEVDVVGDVGDKNFSSSLSNSPFLKLLLLPPPPPLLPLTLFPRILFRKTPSFLEEEEDEEGTNKSSMLYDELNVPSLFFDNSDFDGEVPLLLLLLLKMDDLTKFLMLNFDPPLLLLLLLLVDCLLFELDDEVVVAGPKSNCTRLL